jgi:hypothetical protein
LDRRPPNDNGGNELSRELQALLASFRLALRAEGIKPNTLAIYEDAVSDASACVVGEWMRRRVRGSLR